MDFIYYDFSDSTTKITSTDLSAGDVDSDDKDLLYTLTSDLKIGSLLVIIEGTPTRISARGPVKTFTQTDIIMVCNRPC